MSSRSTHGKLASLTLKKPAFVALLLTMTLLAVDNADSDDRFLLGESGSAAAGPYVFMMLDTSGSMNRSPRCTQSDTYDDIDPFDAACTTECNLGDALCEDICPSDGCIEYAFDDPDNPLIIEQEIIVDADTCASPNVMFVPGCNTFGGARPEWRCEVTTDPGFKGAGYCHDRNPGEFDLPLKTATFDPSISVDGTYQVWVSYPPERFTSHAENAMISIVHDGGTDTVRVDHQTVPDDASADFDDWVLIGSYEMSTGVSDSGKVTIRSEAGDRLVIADAVRWTRVTIPPCLETGFRCQLPICDSGDCYVALNGDDPGSKFFQAKEALFNATQSIETVHFGFGHYEQDNPRLQAKHWLYRVRALDAAGVSYTPPTLGGQVFLAAGDDEVFGNYSLLTDPAPTIGNGDGFDCHTARPFLSASDQQVACNDANPADITDVWEAQRAHRVPKLGVLGTYETDVWYRTDYDNSEIYRVRYKPISPIPVTFGSDILEVDIDVYLCPSASGCPAMPTATGKAFYDLVSEYAARDFLTRRRDERAGFFTAQRNVFAGDGTGMIDTTAGTANNENTCRGVELNNDSNTGDAGAATDLLSDIWQGYNIFWKTEQDARGDDWNFDGVVDFDGVDLSTRRDWYDVGDFIPLDWLNRYDDEIQRRLAPNIVRTGDIDPDFRIAEYFRDDFNVADPTGTFTRILRLGNDDLDGDTSDDERPLIAFGNTPLGESLEEFRTWYEAWNDHAPTADADFACREKVVLMVTDGLDTCEANFGFTDPTVPPALLLGDSSSPTFDPSTSVSTHVIGFGLDASSQLNAMATAGGTGAPLLARNGAELQTALESILTSLEADNRTFASASIPAIQSSAADKIFLSSFVPIPHDPLAVNTISPYEVAPGFWPGRIDAFREPLPLDADDQPDTTRACLDTMTPSNSRQSGCHLWEAGDLLCEQADAGTRKVIYGMAPETGGLPITGSASWLERPVRGRRLQVPEYLTTNPSAFYSTLPAADKILVDDIGTALLANNVWEAYQADIVDNDFVAIRLQNIIDKTTGLKGIPDAQIGNVEACDVDGDGTDESFVLGDIFHASPAALSGPSNFTYFSLDLCGPAQRTDIPSNCVPPDTLDFGEDRGYRRFTADHVWRRRMLIVGANDGQLHFFDTGIRQVVDDTSTQALGDTVELFNDGGGKELFSYVPRLVMPIIRDQAEGVRHVYSMDGSVSVADAFIDPVDADGSSTLTDRNWRTVLVGGLREAGDFFLVPDRVDDFKSGYFALDITQPDIVGERTTNEDITLVPCAAAGCDETSTPPTEFNPTCQDEDSTGLVTASATCPFRINSPPDPIPFPAELWSFTDSWEVEEPTDVFTTYFLDEDLVGENGRGFPDLADTWSRPVIGQIAMCAVGGANCLPGGSDLITKHVAIFGGGMDPENKDAPVPDELRGTYLYMVDIETGRSIYKRRLGTGTGSAPADPAVLDIDRDGIFDVVYMGTTDGFLYKVNLTPTSGSAYPNLVSLDITADQLIRDEDDDGEFDGNFETFADASTDVSVTDTTVIVSTERVTDAAWEPFQILNTEGAPIYFPPTAFFIPELNRFGLALGSGDREDLWSFGTGDPVGKFFVFVDDDFRAADISPATPCVSQLPIKEECLVSFPFTEVPFSPDANLLLDPPDDLDTLPGSITVSEQVRPGWVLTFPITGGSPTAQNLQESRVTTEAFVVAGILVFSVFDPNTVAVSSTPGTLECSRTGTTRSFVLQIQNAGPVSNLNTTVPPPSGTSGLASLTAEDRFHEIEEFTTAPFIERTASKNDPDLGDERTILDAIDEQVGDSIREALLGNLPRGSRFNDAFQVVISALRNSTGVNVYASIPIAIYPADWRDQ